MEELTILGNTIRDNLFKLLKTRNECDGLYKKISHVGNFEYDVYNNVEFLQDAHYFYNLYNDIEIIESIPYLTYVLTRFCYDLIETLFFKFRKDIDEFVFCNEMSFDSITANCVDGKKTFNNVLLKIFINPMRNLLIIGSVCNVSSVEVSYSDEVAVIDNISYDNETTYKTRCLTDSVTARLYISDNIESIIEYGFIFNKVVKSIKFSFKNRSVIFREFVVGKYCFYQSIVENVLFEYNNGSGYIINLKRSCFENCFNLKTVENIIFHKYSKNSLNVFKNCISLSYVSIVHSLSYYTTSSFLGINYQLSNFCGCPNSLRIDIIDIYQCNISIHKSALEIFNYLDNINIKSWLPINKDGKYNYDGFILPGKDMLAFGFNYYIPPNDRDRELAIVINDIHKINKLLYLKQNTCYESCEFWKKDINEIYNIFEKKDVPIRVIKNNLNNCFGACNYYIAQMNMIKLNSIPFVIID